jgi:hypothetical protein
MSSKPCLALMSVMLALSAATAVRAADPAPFDLAGPIIQVTVTRDGKTLPVSQVPNLAAGSGSRPICPSRNPRITSWSPRS